MAINLDLYDMTINDDLFNRLLIIQNINMIIINPEDSLVISRNSLWRTGNSTLY